MTISCENPPKGPVDTFRARRQMERFMRALEQAPETGVVGDEPIATIHYDKGNQRVTVTYLNPEKPSSDPTS